VLRFRQKEESPTTKNEEKGYSDEKAVSLAAEERDILSL